MSEESPIVPPSPGTDRERPAADLGVAYDARPDDVDGSWVSNPLDRSGDWGTEAHEQQVPAGLSADGHANNAPEPTNALQEIAKGPGIRDRLLLGPVVRVRTELIARKWRREEALPSAGRGKLVRAAGRVTLAAILAGTGTFLALKHGVPAVVVPASAANRGARHVDGTTTIQADVTTSVQASGGVVRPERVVAVENRLGRLLGTIKKRRDQRRERKAS